MNPLPRRASGCGEGMSVQSGFCCPELESALTQNTLHLKNTRHRVLKAELRDSVAEF